MIHEMLPITAPVSIIETILWKNPDTSQQMPTSGSSSIVNLTINNDGSTVANIRDYDYLKFVYKKMYSDDDSTAISQIISVKDFITCGKDGQADYRPVFMLGAYPNSMYYARMCFYNTDSSILFRTTYTLNNAASATSPCIPIKIIGLNSNLKPKLQEKILWTNANPSNSSGFPSTNITMPESLDNFDYIKFTFAWSNSNLSLERQQEIIIPMNNFKTCNSTWTKYPSAAIVAGDYWRFRPIRYDNTTQVTIFNCYYCNGSTGMTANPAVLIPLNIVGIQEI